MQFELKDVLSAAGPSASLIFAAWIFLSFLQARYTSAYERYRSLVSEVREKRAPSAAAALSAERRRSLEEQVRLYKRRCEQMRVATNTGVAAAIVLVTGVLVSVLGLAAPDVAALKYVSVGALVLGLLLVIAAASFVLRENTSIQRALDAELADLPDLARS